MASDLIVPFDGELTGYDLEPGDEHPSRLQMACHIRDSSSLAPRRQKDHDVACHDDGVEQAAKVNSHEVSEPPVYAGRLSPRRSEHLRVEVDPNNVQPATSELAPDAARPATAIEDGRRRKPFDEVGFTVDVLAGCSETVVGCVVDLAGRAPALQPTF